MVGQVLLGLRADSSKLGLEGLRGFSLRGQPRFVRGLLAQALSLCVRGRELPC